MGFMRSMALGAVVGVELAGSTLSNIAAVGRGLDNVRTKLGFTGSSMMGLTTTFGALSLAGAGVLATLGMIAKAGLDSAAAMEQTEIAFATMLGSNAAALSFLNELQAFAKKTPFEFTELTVAARRMKAFGFETDAILPLLTSMGDAIAAMGGSSEMIERTTLALGQMRTKGRVMTQEMNQLTETGIFGWDHLAKSIGKTPKEAMKLVEEGAISAEVGIRAFMEHSASAFSNAMDRQSRTFLGMISNLKDSAGFMLRDLFRPGAEALKATMMMLVQGMGGFD